MGPPADRGAHRSSSRGTGGRRLARRRRAPTPTSSLVWAVLAEQALDAGNDVAAYAFARTDTTAVWTDFAATDGRAPFPFRGRTSPIRVSCGALSALGQAAVLFEEEDEVARFRALLLDADRAIPSEMLP